MAGNKYPEITERTILDAAKRLFLEKGYEQITLQDIANACGLTRGAIYHHFKGKEEMLDAVTTYMFHETTPYHDVRVDASLNGLEKLRQLIIASNSTAEQVQMYHVLSQTFYKSPKLVSSYLLDCQTTVIPMIQELIEEGIADGSIPCDNPGILAEILTVFTDIWLSPLVFQTTKEKFLLKVTYMKMMLESVGLPLINEELVSAFEHMSASLYKE